MTGAVTVSIAEGAIVSEVCHWLSDLGKMGTRYDATTDNQLKPIPNVHPQPLIYLSLGTVLLYPADNDDTISTSTTWRSMAQEVTISPQHQSEEPHYV
jgi:hypothetical protein